MIQFFLNGGPPMLFIVILGLAGLVSAGRFMSRPDPRRVGTAVALTVGLVFAAVTGVATDVAAFTTHVARLEGVADGERAAMALQGLSESMSPAILGGTFACVIWLMMAVGFRRLAARLPPPA
jgi:ABC-type Fe3+ transport system permease subunit